MKAVVLEREGEELIPLTLGCPKLMLNIMDRPLIYHIKDFLLEIGIDSVDIFNKYEKGEFPSELEDSIHLFNGKDELLKFIKDEREDIILITRPFLSDMPIMKAILWHQKNENAVTSLFCRGKATGIYIISADSDFEREEIKKLNINGYFSLIENGEEYISCHRDILKGRLKLKTESFIKNRGVLMGENTLLKIGAQIKPPVFIGKGTVIESGAKIEAYSVIGSDCVISSGARIGGSVVNKGCFIGEDAVLKKALVAPLTRIKRNATLNELSMVGKASVIGEAAILSDRVLVWDKKFVPDGERVTKNVTSGGRIPVFKFFENTVSGEAGADFSPEDASRLGACFSRLNPALRITVASSGSAASLMIKYAFISGIMSVGGEAVDMGNLPEYIFRFGISHVNASAGVYIAGNESTLIKFFGRDSLSIRGKDMKRLKDMYPLSDFARTEASGIKKLIDASNINKVYYETVSSLLNKKKGYAYGSFQENEKEYASYLSQKSGITLLSKRKSGCISVIADDKRFHICDEEGRLLSDEELYKLYKYILKKEGKKICENDYLKFTDETGAETQSLMLTDRVFAFFKIAVFIAEQNTGLKDLLVFLENV